MIAVLFEVEPSERGRAEYLATAAALRGELGEVDGFLSLERFESLSTPGRILSLSFWRDEEAVRRWRTAPRHRLAQAGGLQRLFRGYRLRVAEVLRDYGPKDRAQAPVDPGTDPPVP